MEQDWKFSIANNSELLGLFFIIPFLPVDIAYMNQHKFLFLPVIDEVKKNSTKTKNEENK